MSTPKKYKRGKVLSPAEVVAAVEAGKPVYHHHKVQNPAWIQNYMVRTIIFGYGSFFEAILISPEK